MSKQVYISADYANDNGDRNVVNTLNSWGNDDYHKVDFIDMSKVASGSVSRDPDCRACDLKKEFNRQINASSAVIFVVGDKTSSRTAGSSCSRADIYSYSNSCTPYKQNTNGVGYCKRYYNTYSSSDVNEINNFSYLRHEFEQAKKKNKPIIIIYNSTRNESSWLPSYMKGFESNAFPFWTYDTNFNKIGNYSKLKEALGYV